MTLFPQSLILLCIAFIMTAGCTTIDEAPLEEDNHGSEIVQRIDQPTVPSQQEQKTDMPFAVIANKNITTRAMHILLEDVNTSNINNSPNLFITIRAEDLHKDPAESAAKGNFRLRDPLAWSGMLFITPNDITPFFLCDFTSNKDIWTNTYCIDLEDLPQTMYDQPIFFIYTPEETEKILRQPTLRSIDESEYTYIFKITLHKP